jgi:hypothetical protein
MRSSLALMAVIFVGDTTELDHASRVEEHCQETGLGFARWGVSANKGANNVQGVLYLTAAAASPRRAKVYDLSMGCGAAPADNAFIWIIQRCSTAATATGLTPNSLDPADTLASTIVAAATVTVDATLTANAFMYRDALNQRATFRWVAAPYGELIIPATTSNGFMFGLSAASTTTFDAGANYEEY